MIVSITLGDSSNLQKVDLKLLLGKRGDYISNNYDYLNVSILLPFQNDECFLI